MTLESNQLVNVLLVLQAKAQSAALLAAANLNNKLEWFNEGRYDGIQAAINIINQLACCGGWEKPESKTYHDGQPQSDPGH